MKRFYILSSTVIVFLTFFASCYYDSEEALYPEFSTSCDTINVTFNTTIVSLLNNNCYSCHSNNTADTFGSSIRLQNYADVVANATKVSGSIKHSANFKPMPKNASMIKSCSITQFNIWVRKGMINN
jgi:hypothetical protein